MPAFLQAQALSTIIIAAILIFLCIAILRKPIGCLLRLCINTIGGFFVLLLLNFLGGFIGVSLGLSWFNAIVVGIFGLPGVGFLLILQWIFAIQF